MATKKTTAQSKQKKAQSKGRSAARKPGQQSRQKQPASIPVRWVLTICCCFLLLLCLFACLGGDGFVLVWVRGLFRGLFGTTGLYLSPVLLAYWIYILGIRRREPAVLRSVSIWMFAISVGAVAHQFYPEQQLPGSFDLIPALYATGASGASGGVLSGLLGTFAELALAHPLADIVLILLSVFWLMMSFNITPRSIVVAIQNRPRPEYEDPEPEPVPTATRVVNSLTERHIARQQQKKRRVSDFDIPVDGKPLGNSGKRKDKPGLLTPDLFPADEFQPLPQGKPDLFEEDPTPDAPFAPEPALPPEEPEELPFDLEREPLSAPAAAPADQASIEKVTAKDARDSAVEVAQEIAAKEAEPKPEYHFPPIELLNNASAVGVDGTAEMRENSRRLNEALQSFKIEARICNVTRGPSVTRYEVELAQGVRLAKVTALQDDIALALGAVGVRISAIPDKIAVVGIEVPNKQVTMVPLREVIDSPQFSRAKSKSSFAVGKDIGGGCVVGNIAQLPHMLIAGTTGSGKSVCMNSIIISLLYKAKPEDVKLIMVDPKMVELGIYNGIPHLLIPVVTDPKKAAGSLQWAVTEMMRRYKMMSDAGVRDLESFNQIVESAGEGEKLPQIVVIIDELADLMLVAAKEVEESICRIAQMGRASGMHLIIATQRPSADVITGLMKANIPSRIAFAVASAMESRIILDAHGAEKLVGKGDMLYAPLGKGKPKRVQGCYVSDGEVEAVTEFVKENYIPDYNQTVMDEIEKKAEQSGKGSKPVDTGLDFAEEETEGDELLPAAVDVILETKQASVSMLQRRLKLGYARAARIIDEMEEKGIVGPFVGSKPRAILITKEQWERIKNGQSPDDAPTEEEPIAELIP